MQVDKEFISFYAHLSYVCFYSVVLLHVPTCEYTGFRCNKKYDGTHNIYQQMNLCLQLCSECFLGKLIKK